MPVLMPAITQFNKISLYKGSKFELSSYKKKNFYIQESSNCPFMTTTLLAIVNASGYWQRHVQVEDFGNFVDVRIWQRPFLKLLQNVSELGINI